jgi:hypothetical protein
MNHFWFRIAMGLIFIYLLALAGLGFWLHQHQNANDKDTYAAFKDMIPILVAIAAAILTGCVQRRISFLTEVRKLYAECVKAVESALQYTYLDQAEQTQFATVYKELASTIELFRASFRKAGDGRGRRQGLFPFEALKSILEWHSYLSFGKNFRKSETCKARKAMLVLWQQYLRPPVLTELDRWTPRSFISHYWGRGRLEGEYWPLPPTNSRPSAARAAITPAADG